MAQALELGCLKFYPSSATSYVSLGKLLNFSQQVGIVAVATSQSYYVNKLIAMCNALKTVPDSH